MYFDPWPKTSREDLFDREEEVERIKALRAPITLVLGLRRAGKSSVILVAASEMPHPVVYIDARRFEAEPYLTFKHVAEALGEALAQPMRRFPKLREYLKNVNGISVAGFEVKISWRERGSLVEVLEWLNRWAEENGRKAVVVIDEAQELTKLKGYNLLKLLAYSYDNLRNVYYVMSGSKMGLLKKFLKLEDAGSPLYGRYMEVVELRPFTLEEAKRFLEEGCRQYGVPPPDAEKVYRAVGGLPGWLTYFGYTYVSVRDEEESIRQTVSYAVDLIKQEFAHFLEGKWAAEKRYRVIMEAAAECAAWSELKRAVEASEGRRINDAEITRLLKNLVDYGFLEKRGDLYCPPDPLIAAAFRKKYR
ncbi:ATP-binding protein [Pyrobaculum sp.]|uniref:AAA family ATPase n=1 Tax=Pyrobaculum sp. TaxID=2004705 RepID=UPI0031658FE0